MPSFLPLPSVMPSAFSFPFPLLFFSLTLPFPLSRSLPIESGNVDTTPENLANLYVRTCILNVHFICRKLSLSIMGGDHITGEARYHGSTVTISALDISKAFDTVVGLRYALLNSVNG